MKSEPSLDHQVAEKLGWILRDGKWVDPLKFRTDANGDVHYLPAYEYGTLWRPTKCAAQMEPLIEKYRISVIAAAKPHTHWIATNSDTKLITTQSESRLEAAALCLLQMDLDTTKVAPTNKTLTWTDVTRKLMA